MKIIQADSGSMAVTLDFQADIVYDIKRIMEGQKKNGGEKDRENQRIIS